VASGTAHGFTTSSVNIEKMYTSLDEALSKKEFTVATKLVMSMYHEVIMDDVCSSVMSSYVRCSNLTAFWSLLRKANELDQQQVMTIGKGGWKAFFANIRHESMRRCKLMRSRETVMNDYGCLFEVEGKLSKYEKLHNANRGRTINVEIARISKKVIFIYSLLNDVVKRMDLNKLDGCGFIRPTVDGAVSVARALEIMEVTDSNYVTMARNCPLSEEDLSYFRDVVLAKEDRASLPSLAQAARAARAAKKLKTEATKSTSSGVKKNSVTFAKGSFEVVEDIKISGDLASGTSSPDSVIGAVVPFVATTEDALVSSSWHTKDMSALRKPILDGIMEHLFKHKPANAPPDWLDSSKQFVQRVERSLFFGAGTLEEYADLSTLKERLRAVGKNKKMIDNANTLDVLNTPSVKGMPDSLSDSSASSDTGGLLSSSGYTTSSSSSSASTTPESSRLESGSTPTVSSTCEMPNLFGSPETVRQSGDFVDINRHIWSADSDVLLVSPTASAGGANERGAMRDAKHILNALFVNSKGTSMTGFRVEHVSKVTKLYPRVDYLRDLALLTLFISDLVKSYGSETVDLADTVATILDHQMFKSVFSFRVFRGFPLQEVNDASSNTVGDGYCLFNASLQCQMRDAHGMSIRDLRAFDTEKSRQNSLVPHIEKYIKLVQPADPKTRTFAQGKLNSTRYQAVTFPNAVNPFSTWGNGMFLPFLDFSVMLIDFQLIDPMLFSGDKWLFGCLARVNRDLSGTLVEENLPDFTYPALMRMCGRVNYMAIRHSHFFIMDNPVNEIESAHEACCEWAGEIVLKIMALSSDEISRVRSFVNRITTITSGAISYSGCSSNTSSSAAEVVDLVSDDEEEIITKGSSNLNSEFSFDVNVPPSVKQREMMLTTVRESLVP
jgi:hypothetical protein